MIAWIDGIKVQGTPTEIYEFKELAIQNKYQKSYKISFETLNLEQIKGLHANAKKVGLI